jgi:hypothetical protein
VPDDPLQPWQQELLDQLGTSLASGQPLMIVSPRRAGIPTVLRRLAAALEPAPWVIPPWAEPPPIMEKAAACRSCGAEVLWVLTKHGKRAPINRDGTSHFANCPQADSWRRKEAPDASG